MPYGTTYNVDTLELLTTDHTQVMEMLRQKIMETGLLPTMFKNGGSLINVAPQRMESQSG